MAFPADEEQWIQTVASELGRTHGAPPTPLLVFGCNALNHARLVADHSTLGCVAVAGLDSLDRALAERDYVGIFAMSRMSQEWRGEAGEALSRFARASRRRGVLLYQSWERNVPRGVQRALEVGADGVFIAPMLADEMLGYLFGVLVEVEQGAAVPTTAEQHVERLRRFAPRSPFWNGPPDFASEYW